PGFFVVGLARSSSSTRVPSTTLFRSGALTGVPLYGPAVWALFSKRQTAFSVLFVTIASLAVNVFFKFISPALLEISLDRMQETGSEEHTSELQSRENIVCRLLLEKKK